MNNSSKDNKTKNTAANTKKQKVKKDFIYYMNKVDSSIFTWLAIIAILILGSILCLRNFFKNNDSQ